MEPARRSAIRSNWRRMAQAFRASTTETAFCAVGSVKTNVGHLQIASGVAGFIKAALALYHRQIPATLHFEKPNPRIDFANSPFYVNTSLARLVPRRAAPAGWRQFHGDRRHQCACHPGRGSAATDNRLAPRRGSTCSQFRRERPAALRALIGRYREALEQFDDASLPNVCFTAAIGRVHFAERFTAVGSTIADLKGALAAALSQAENGAAERAGQPARSGSSRFSIFRTGIAIRRDGSRVVRNAASFPRDIKPMF